MHKFDMVLRRIIQRFKKVRYERAISPESVQDRFANIYRQNIWFSNRQSSSGAGSTLDATRHIRQELPIFLREVGATNLVDLGCGDYNWMKAVDLPCGYLGLDIVPEVVKKNQELFSSELVEFRVHDAIRDELPSSADVVLCREVLFHLSFEHGRELINRVVDSNARYFLATTSDSVAKNSDIRTGRFRNINLQLEPYEFPAYVHAISDSERVSSDRLLAVWKVDDLRKSLH